MMNTYATEFDTNSDLLNTINEINALLLAQVERKQAQLVKLKQRRHERINDVWNRLRIIDWQTKQEIGHVADISLGGFRVKSAKLLPQNKTYFVQIEVNTQGDFSKIMALEARISWQKNQLDSDLYEAGFYFTNLSADNGQNLRQIISMLQASAQLAQTTLH